jgi:hypothetical protein
MNLLTVTCNQDKQAMLLQAESISKYLEPTRHYVVVNEPDADLRSWRELLSQYYTRHELVLMNYGRYGGQGWHTQQCYKLMIGLDIDTDYLVLDSKNFFIKPTSLRQWDNIDGDNTTRLISDKPEFIPANLRYARYFEVEPFERVLSICTPFKIRHQVIKQWGRDTIDWFAKQTDIVNSEFVLYSYMLQGHYQTTQQKLHYSWWQGDTIPETITNIPDNIHVLGIHRLCGHTTIPKQLGFTTVV